MPILAQLQVLYRTLQTDGCTILNYFLYRETVVQIEKPLPSNKVEVSEIKANYF